jgi:hypothetical protein
MAPFQQEQLSQATHMFVDVTYTGNTMFPYLLNMVTFNERILHYNAVARVLCNKQDGESYATSIKTVFDFVSKKYTKFENGKNLKEILVDFDDAQANGFRKAMGEEVANKVLRGCKVHWLRSVQRVSKMVTKNQEEAALFERIAKKATTVREKKDVYAIFDILCCKKSLNSNESFLEDIPLRLKCTDTTSWKKLTHWTKWWTRQNHLRMFTYAFTNLDEEEWRDGPETTNPVESINRQSIKEKGGHLRSLLENIYREDRNHAVKITAAERNVTTSYNNNSTTARANRNSRRRLKRKRTSVDNEQDVEVCPPDKRRQVERSGKKLINSRVEIEYKMPEEENHVRYLGWFAGTIIAYNKNKGYLVEFDDPKEDADWIENIYSTDVRFV